MKSYAPRYLNGHIAEDLQQKMVFVGGPRQVGKTTLAKHLLSECLDGYLNWDISAHRELILQQILPDTPIWCFDEIHKYQHWRNYLKGLYDAYQQRRKILVTGSARLDYYRRGGDSLQGRYHYLRLHPLSIAELKLSTMDDFDQLLALGGFPEPFLSGSAVRAKRWSREYRQRLIQEDLVSLEHVRDLGTIELLMMRLPNVVGSPLSVNALREDLQVSHKAVTHWLTIFENLYAIFRIPPFGASRVRAVKKEQKHYHYDWSLVPTKGARFENLVASHLLKWVHYQQDTLARELELRYFRDTDGREVDFIIVEDSKPIIAIECKYNNKDVAKSLAYFKKRFPECEAWQLCASDSQPYVTTSGIHLCHALSFLQKLV